MNNTDLFSSEFWCNSGHLNKDQSIFIMDLVQELKPKYVLETGFCTGRSTMSVLYNNPDILKFVNIDINYDYDKKFGRYMMNKLKESFNVFNAIEISSSIVLTNNFITNEFPNGIDWFTVDGDHTYRGCLFDLNSVSPYMNKNGVILVDDYKSGPPNGCVIKDVTNACDDFYKQNNNLYIKKEWNCKGKGFCIFIKI